MKHLIPIAFMFNNNYAIPAGVTFYSLLKNACRDYFYNLYVLSSDMSKSNVTHLYETVTQFTNASLEFIDIGNKFSDLWQKTSVKGHFSKEMFCKFTLPSMFPQHDYMLVSDVDVVFSGDVSKCLRFIREDNENYLSGIRIVGKISGFMERYKHEFTDEEISRLSIGAGFMAYNLKKMREDSVESKFLNCFNDNFKRLFQAEQDVINLVCYDKITYLPLNYMVCSYMYDLYKDNADFESDINYSSDELIDAMNNPIQLHYATHIKPWSDPLCTKAEIWFKYLAETPFFRVYQNNYYKNRFNRPQKKTYFKVKLWKHKSRCITLELKKEWNK